MLGAEEQVVDLGVRYLRIVITTAGPRMLAIMLTRALQGAGDTRTPLVIRTIGTVTNIAVTVLLVAGLLGLPQLGVTGAAIGTATGNVLSAAILVVYLKHGSGVIRFRREGIWAPDTLRRIVTIGAPQVLERNLYAVGAIPLNAIVLVFGTAANAGFQIGRRVQLYALLPSRGVGTAASTYMGMRVGEGDPDAGDRYGRAGIRLALLISAAVAVPAFLFADPVAGIFLNDPDALGVTSDWIRVYAIATIARAVYGVLRGAMQGAGETRAPLVATAVGILVFALGLSWVLGVGLGLGLAGVFVGVILDPVSRTVLLYRWYDQGRWRRALDQDVVASTHPQP
ncbi:MAG: MATE family efflux transporter [Actinobacteria bacterium]|nr:MATE family efflux transporter [Actinomycetota bacterium]